LSDVDECEEQLDDCHRESNAMCNDTDGSFNCSCRMGFDGNGTFCEGTMKALLVIADLEMTTGPQLFRPCNIAKWLTMMIKVLPRAY